MSLRDCKFTSNIDTISIFAHKSISIDISRIINFTDAKMFHRLLESLLTNIMFPIKPVVPCINILYGNLVIVMVTVHKSRIYTDTHHVTVLYKTSPVYYRDNLLSEEAN